MFELRNIISRLFICILISVAALETIATGETLTATVVNHAGNPVANAVISAMPSTGPSRRPANAPKVVIDQVDKEFIDYVNPIQAGTVVSFPNNDKIRHQIYSFSAAKTFEIPLYPPGTTAEAHILFDKPGEVIVGCNIHDWMKAYIYVVETPYFAKTDVSGKGVISGIPPGEYELSVWHPNIDKKQAETQKKKLKIVAGKNGEDKFEISMTKDWRSRRAPFAAGTGGYYR